jgi:hypothetical protein
MPIQQDSICLRIRFHTIVRRKLLSVFCGSTSKFSATLLKGVDGGTWDTRNYTGLGRDPTSSVEICEFMFLSSSAPKGLQRDVCKLGFYREKGFEAGEFNWSRGRTSSPYIVSGVRKQVRGEGFSWLEWPRARGEGEVGELDQWALLCLALASIDMPKHGRWILAPHVMAWCIMASLCRSWQHYADGGCSLTWCSLF